MVLKKIILIVLIFLTVNIEVFADSYMYTWEEGSTYVTVPLNANILDYLNVPKAKLYRNNKLLDDADIVYNYNGDWLYLLTDVDTSKVGDYLVWYKLSELKYKPGQCQGYKSLVTFHVGDTECPKILDKPNVITYKIGNKIPDYKDYITVVDNSGNLQVKIIDNEVNYSKIGSYQVTILASDGFNSSKEYFTVNVIDDESPKITYLGDDKGIIIPLNEEADISAYFKAIDDVDGDVTYTISYDEFDTSIESKFPLVVTFYDLQGNSSSFNIMVQIIDESEPEIVLTQATLLLDYETDFSLYNFKTNVYSAYDGKKDIINQIYIDSSNVVNEVGVYSVYYCYQDKEEIYKVECKVHLLSNKNPVINTYDIEITEGFLPDYTDYIDISDPSDTTILESTQIDDSRVNYGITGTYPVYITVTNSSGLSTTETLLVTIVERKEKEIDWKMVVIILMGVYFVGNKVLMVLKRKRD